MFKIIYNFFLNIYRKFVPLFSRASARHVRTSTNVQRNLNVVPQSNESSQPNQSYTMSEETLRSSEMVPKKPESSEVPVLDLTNQPTTIRTSLPTAQDSSSEIFSNINTQSAKNIEINIQQPIEIIASPQAASVTLAEHINILFHKIPQSDTFFEDKKADTLSCIKSFILNNILPTVQQYKTEFNDQLIRYNKTYPNTGFKISDFLNAEWLNIKLACKKAWLSDLFGGSSDIPEDTVKIQTIINKLAQPIQNLISINTMLDYVIREKGKYPVNIHVKNRFNQDEPSNIDSMTYVIKVNDIALGYTVHNMLDIVFFQKDIAANVLPRSASVYDGRLEFELDKETLIALKNYLSQLNIWFRDFDNIMLSLLGKDAAHYSITGQKPLSEIIKAEDTRNIKFIEPDVVNKMRQMDLNTKVLLLGQLALDLKEHPNREQLKNMLESLYLKYGLKDSAGQDKTFIKDDAYRYTTLLSIDNIKQIYHDLMAQTGVVAAAQAMGFNSAADPNFLFILSANSPEQAYQAYLKQNILDLPLTGNMQSKQNFAYDFENSVNANNINYLAIQNAFTLQLHALLKQKTALVVQISQPSVELNEEQLKALLPDGTQAFNINPKFDRQDVDYMFKKFKDCVIVQEINSQRTDASLVTHINLLQQEFKSRLTRTQNQDSNTYYGPRLVQRSLENCFSMIVKTVYFNELGYTRESVEDAMIIIDSIATDTTYFSSSCEGGLEGKLYQINSKYVSVSAQFLKPMVLNHMRIVSEEVFIPLATETHPGHEADIYRFKQHFDYQLGLIDKDSQLEDHPGLKSKFFARFAAKCTPDSIYKHCYETVFENVKLYIRDDNEDELYQLIHQLHLKNTPINDSDRATYDKDFRIDGSGTKWMISKIQEKMPALLILRLKHEGILDDMNSNQLIFKNLEGETLRYQSIIQPIIQQATYSQYNNGRVSQLGIHGPQNNDSNTRNSASFNVEDLSQSQLAQHSAGTRTS